MTGEVADPSICLVPITSDKGLCGAVNTSIVRELKRMVKDDGINRTRCNIFSIGDKGSRGCCRPFPDMLRTSIS